MRTICALLACATTLLALYTHALAQPAPPSAGSMYVALLLDSSGSMQGVQGNVQDVARRALDLAPPTMHMSVARFSDAVQPIQGYTADRQAIRAAIDSLGEPGGNTCLYDALYTALQELDQVGDSSVRKSVILFTDGQDLRLDPDGTEHPCSAHSADQVVALARESGIAIHTIGMYSLPENIKREELEAIARETSGVSAIGNVADVSRLFAEVFSALSSTAAEPPAQGPTPGVEVRQPYPDLERNVYIVQFAITSPHSVNTAEIEIVGKGNRIPPQHEPVQGRELITLEIPGANFKNGVEYEVTVRLLDSALKCIPPPADADRFSSQGKSCIEQSSKPFTSELPPLLSKASILPPIPDFIAGELQIPLRVMGNDDRISKYEGVIASSAGGSQRFEGIYHPGQAITVVMPDFMVRPRNGRTEGPEYTIELDLIPVEGEPLFLKTEEPFHATPPPWHARLFHELETTPLLLLLFGLVALAPLFWLVLGRGERKPRFPIQPPGDYTDDAPASVPTHRDASLSLQVTATPHTPDRKRFTITAFPCTVGRSPDCDVVLLGDAQMSRRHLLITAADGEFAVTDLGSNNGTWLDGKKLSPLQPVKLSDMNHLRLGEHTSLELRVQYQGQGQGQTARQEEQLLP